MLVGVGSGCGDEASDGGQFVPEAAAGSAGASGGGASAPATEVSGGGGVGPSGSSETPNAGLGAGTPVDGDGAEQMVSGAAMGGTAGDGSMAGAASVGGTASVGGATGMGGATGGAGSGTPAGSPFPSGVTRPRILIVGDSISAGPGCYKKYLLADLNAAGFTSFDFVGEYTDDCGGGVMHGARSCSTAQQYTQPTFTLQAECGAGPWPGLSALAAEYRPDLIMMQLGVNDVWGGMATENILASYTTLVQQARAQNPNVVLAVAQIQKIRPMDAGGDATFARTQQLIEALPAWAMAQSQPTSPVFVADLWTNSDVAQTLDGVHPDDAGAQRMGQNWFAALSTILPKN
ncbi:MAG TPA: GDSL-type esterase/lipase family protein [Polyangiaceae bacterium]|nr:GDSL-type esterase/lipase family protein [Polyangiaceae bacterium]